jgi:hypothetical protein
MDEAVSEVRWSMVGVSLAGTLGWVALVALLAASRAEFNAFANG